jgi:hypothetical protein
VSVARCGGCGTWYWRYWRGDATRPAGFCSFTCWTNRPRKLMPGIVRGPLWYVSELRAHRLEAHGTDDVLGWFNCETCESIEARYRASVSYALF